MTLAVKALNDKASSTERRLQNVCGIIESNGVSPVSLTTKKCSKFSYFFLCMPDDIPSYVDKFITDEMINQSHKHGQDNSYIDASSRQYRLAKDF